MYENFEHAFWNHLHFIFIGADNKRTFKVQKDYMLLYIIEQYGVKLEAHGIFSHSKQQRFHNHSNVVHSHKGNQEDFRKEQRKMKQNYFPE